MKKILLFCFVSLCLFSCKTTEPVTQVPVRTQITVIEKLIPVAMPADSTMLVALFECDSNYNVLLRAFTDTKTKGIESLLNFSNNQLSYNAKTKGDTVFVKGKDSIIHKEIPIEVPVRVEVNVLTAWQNFFIIMGKILCGLVALLLIYFVAKMVK